MNTYDFANKNFLVFMSALYELFFFFCLEISDVLSQINKTQK